MSIDFQLDFNWKPDRTMWKRTTSQHVRMAVDFFYEKLPSLQQNNTSFLSCQHFVPSRYFCLNPGGNLIPDHIAVMVRTAVLNLRTRFEPRPALIDFHWRPWISVYFKKIICWNTRCHSNPWKSWLEQKRLIFVHILMIHFLAFPTAQELQTYQKWKGKKFS